MDDKTFIRNYVDFLKIILYMPFWHVLYLDSSPHPRDGLTTLLAMARDMVAGVAEGRLPLAKNAGVLSGTPATRGKDLKKNAAFFL